ncbi:sulfite exporter TauE/SafE family protein [Candidatus Aerophobetes bacterium]|nr:sulfite exporter TauE/SafE family protein [Candidatus Aerophobetes bacterium]
MFDFFFLIAFGAGVLSFLSPCILPLIPSYVSFITGVSLVQLTESSQDTSLKRRIIITSLLFIMGFSIIFVGLGASASFVGEILQRYQHWISRVGGIFIVIMGLYLMGILRIPVFDRERKIHLNKPPLGYWEIPIVGAVFAAGWTPCVGPILGSILFYASTTASIIKGIVLLSFYSAGLAVPFFASSLAIGVFLERYKGFKKNMRIVSLVSGGLLIAIGILLVSDIFPYLGFLFPSMAP